MYLKSRRGVCPYLRGWFTHGAAQIRRGITFGGGAPLARRDFRPTGAISGDKSNPTHTRALWIEGHDVPEITTRGLALFCVDGSRTERLKSGAVLRLEVVRPMGAPRFSPYRSVGRCFGYWCWQRRTSQLFYGAQGDRRDRSFYTWKISDPRKQQPQ
jgi:hypothetical protein